MASNLRSAVAYDVVVSVEWSGGTRRYAGKSFAIPRSAGPAPISVEGRLVSTSTISLGTDGVSDSATVTLDNTGFGGTSTVESNWSDAAPPEGTPAEVAYCFDGDDWSSRIILLYGNIAEISGLTDREVTVVIHGIDATLPQQINKEINLTDYPDAPRASVGRMQQIVFGSVLRMEGIPVTTIAKTQTTDAITATDTTIPVGDVSQLPASGTVLIGDVEQVTYTSIVNNVLTGCVRGASSTTPADFGSGTVVVEVGNLRVLLAGHGLFSLDNVWGVSGSRIAPLDPTTYALTSGSLASYLDFAGGWPTIPVPSGKLVPQQIQMDVPNPGAIDQAQNPLGACGNAPGWSPKSYATLVGNDPSAFPPPPYNETLDVIRTLPIAPIGDIVRVYVVVEYDAAPLSLVDSFGNNLVPIYVGASPLIGYLLPGGVLPTDWVDLMGLTNLTAYTGTHDHNVPAGANTQEICYRGSNGGAGTAIYQNGGAGYWTVNEANLHDASQATFGESTQSVFLGYPINWKSFMVAGGSAGKTLVRVRAHCKFETTTPVVVGAIAHLALFLFGTGNLTTIPLPIGTASSPAADFATPWYVTSSWTDLVNMWAVVQFNTTSKGARIYESWLEVEWATAASATNLIDAVVYGTPAVYDVTAQWDGTWGWFLANDIYVKTIGKPPTTVNIIRAYYVCAVSPFHPTPCDRILADVGGLAPAGLPTDILLNALTLVGLSGRYNATDFAAAAAILSASSLNYKQDFVQYQAISGAALLQMICAEARLRCFWEKGLLCVVYLPDLASLPAPSSAWGDNDLKDELVVLSRTPIVDVFTLLNATYNYDGFIKADAKAGVATATVALSTRRQTVSFKTISDDNSAETLAEEMTERAAKPRYQISATFFLPGLSLRRGSIIQITAGRRTYSKVEILGVTIQDQYVTITGVVWDTI